MGSVSPAWENRAVAWKANVLLETRQAIVLGAVLKVNSHRTDGFCWSRTRLIPTWNAGSGSLSIHSDWPSRSEFALVDMKIVLFSRAYRCRMLSVFCTLAPLLSLRSRHNFEKIRPRWPTQNVASPFQKGNPRGSFSPESGSRATGLPNVLAGPRPRIENTSGERSSVALCVFRKVMRTFNRDFSA